MQVEGNVSTYVISTRFLKKQKRTRLMLLLLFPIGLIAAAIFFQGMETLPAMASFLFWQWLIYSAVLLLSGARMNAKIQKNQLLLGDDFVQRISGEAEAPIPFAEIQNLLVRKESDGTVRFVRIKTGGKTVTLYGFKEMDAIAQRICASAANAEQHEKQYRFDYDSPCSMTLIFVTACAVLVLTQRVMQFSLAVVFMLGVGVWFLLGKPISTSQGKRFRALELILGTVIVVVYLLLLWLSF